MPDPEHEPIKRLIFEDLLPGETPIDDATGLLIPGIATRKELSFHEGLNIMKALVKYFDAPVTSQLAPFDFEWFKTLHREMFGDVWNWAGIFRTRNFNIGVPWSQVQEKLYNLAEDLPVWKASGMDLVEQAALLHHGSVKIHPFANGNGRWGRALTNIWLNLNGSPEVVWLEHLIGDISSLRNEYILALQAADEGDMDPLTALHREHLRKI